jgi:hypothetical protein
MFSSTVIPQIKLSMRIGLALSFGAFALAACQHDPIEGPVVDDNGGNGGGGTNPCDPNTVYFQQQVLPILISNCAVPGCHNTATDQNDWIQITDYQSLMNSGIVQDGDLMEAITETDPDRIMPRPPQAPLTPQQIALINTWIQQGAQNNSCASATCDTLNVTYSGTIVPLIQQRCLGCHSGGTPQGGLDFSSWAVVNAVAMDGRLGRSVTHDATGIPMPPSSPIMPTCEVRKFLLWIEAGAPNN